ncbi:hypothetical protein IAT40_005801 [Kwoniella sp. CBS 6097]
MRINGLLVPIEDDDSDETPPGWFPGYRPTPTQYQYTTPYGTQQQQQQQSPYGSYASQQSPYAQYTRQPSYATQFSQQPLNQHQEYHPSVLEHLLSQGINPLSQQQQQQQQQQQTYGYSPNPQYSGYSYQQPEPQTTFTLEEWERREEWDRICSGRAASYWWEEEPYWKTLGPDSKATIRIIPSEPMIPIESLTLTTPAVPPTAAGTAGTATENVTLPVTGTSQGAGTAPSTTTAPAAATQTTTTAGDQAAMANPPETRSKPLTAWDEIAPDYARQPEEGSLWHRCETVRDMAVQWLSHKSREFDKDIATYKADFQTNSKARQEAEGRLNTMWAALKQTMASVPAELEQNDAKGRAQTIISTLAVLYSCEMDERYKARMSERSVIRHDEAVGKSALVERYKRKVADGTLSTHVLENCWRKWGKSKREEDDGSQQISHFDEYMLDLERYKKRTEDADRRARLRRAEMDKAAGRTETGTRTETESAGGEAAATSTGTPDPSASGAGEGDEEILIFKPADADEVKERTIEEVESDS